MLLEQIEYVLAAPLLSLYRGYKLLCTLTDTKIFRKGPVREKNQHKCFKESDFFFFFKLRDLGFYLGFLNFVFIFGLVTKAEMKHKGTF